MCGLVYVGVWSEIVGVVIEVEWAAPIWLVVGGVTNCYHVVKDNRRIQWISVCLLYR